MAKRPQAGRIKTRLARDIGVAEALRVYRTVLARTIRDLSRDKRWQTWVAVTPDCEIHSNIWPDDVMLVGQGDGDLGKRLQRVFDILPGGPVLIIGSDIPGIRPTDIAAGFSELGSHTAVLGPAEDGGYWLVGQRRQPKVMQLFEGVRWSTEHALQDTLANTDDACLIRQIDDLDTVADYKRWRRQSKV